jgi:hypothetical protein
MSDDTVQPRDGVFYSSSEPVVPADGTMLEPAVQGAPAQYMPAQYTPATPALPAEPAQYTPLQPAQFTPVQYDAGIPALPAEPAQGTPLQPAQFTPVQYDAGIPAEPAVPADGTMLESGERIEAQPADGIVQPRDAVSASSPLQPLECAEAVPLGAAGTPETPQFQEPEQNEPRAYESTGPDAKPAMLDREAAAQPSGDGGDDPPLSTGNPPPSYTPPASTNISPLSSAPPPPPTTSGGGPLISVDTDKLAPLSPTLEGVMRDLDSLGNSTANGIGSYDLVKDSYGEAYDKVATPIATQILQGIFSASSVFGDTAEGADLTVHNYQVTEDNATESANNLLTRSED